MCGGGSEIRFPNCATMQTKIELEWRVNLCSCSRRKILFSIYSDWRVTFTYSRRKVAFSISPLNHVPLRRPQTLSHPAQDSILLQFVFLFKFVHVL